MAKKKKGKSKSNGRSRGPVVRPQRGRVQEPAPAVVKSPPNLGRRVWVVVAVLVAVQGVVWAAREFVLSSVTRELRRPLAELPLELGDYVGADREQDPRVFVAMGAESSISRVYTRGDGRSILVHLGEWDAVDAWAPHSPDVCYPTAGWEERERESLVLATAPPVEAATRVFVDGGQQARVMFWYRLGSVTYLDDYEARAARRVLVGEREWPPVVKVLMQTSADEGSEEALRAFAALVDEWTREL